MNRFRVRPCKGYHRDLYRHEHDLWSIERRRYLFGVIPTPFWVEFYGPYAIHEDATYRNDYLNSQSEE